MPTAKQEPRDGRRRHQSAGAGTTDTPHDDPLVVRSFAKGLSVLSLFDAENRELTLDEIAERSDLPRMTAYRMVRTMERAAYLVVDPATNRYHLGPAMLASMYLTEGYADLVRVARPYLEELASETQESVTLAVEVDGMAVSVDMVDTKRPFKRELALGRIIGDTANSNAKVFLSSKPAAERDRIVALPKPQLTPNTITDREILAQEIAQIAREGVAFDMEERNIGTCAVSAPVRDQIGSVIAAIGVVAPTGRFGPEERRSAAEAVKRKAAALSAFLGYSDSDRPSREPS